MFPRTGNNGAAITELGLTLVLFALPALLLSATRGSTSNLFGILSSGRSSFRPASFVAAAGASCTKSSVRRGPGLHSGKRDRVLKIMNRKSVLCAIAIASLA